MNRRARVTPSSPWATRSNARGGALRTLLIVLMATVLLIPALALFAPSGLAARLLTASDADARLVALSGRLGNGAADLFVEQRFLGRITWHLKPLHLFRGRAVADLRLEEAGHSIATRAALTYDGRVELSGTDVEIREATLDRFLRPYAIEPTGTLTIAGGHAHAQVETGRLLEAEAGAHWSGGQVRYDLGGSSFVAEFPALSADLGMEDGALLVVVTDPEGHGLLEIVLHTDGWADVRVRYRFVAMSGYPWSDPPDPDLIVVEISEQVL